MAAHKMVTWLGDADPQVQTITEGGVVFVKGKAEKVAETHAWLGKFIDNPHFTVDEDAEPEDAGEDDEIIAVKASLDAKGVKYRANASLASLRNLLAANTDTGVHDNPPAEDESAQTAQDKS